MNHLDWSGSQLVDVTADLATEFLARAGEVYNRVADLVSSRHFKLDPDKNSSGSATMSYKLIHLVIPVLGPMLLLAAHLPSASLALANCS
jgi:hypothetical protein